jgi:hypothetical protein
MAQRPIHDHQEWWDMKEKRLRGKLRLIYLDFWNSDGDWCPQYETQLIDLGMGEGITHGKLEVIRRDLAHNAKQSDELSESSGESHRLTPVPGFCPHRTGSGRSTPQNRGITQIRPLTVASHHGKNHTD